MILRANLIAIAMLAVATTAIAQPPSVAIGQTGAGSNTLEIAPQVKPQEAPKVSVPPVEMDSEPVLVIPQASRDFVGRWGGHLELTDSFGDTRPPAETIVGFKFGERNGEVFLRTTVFADPGANLLKTDARVNNPHEVTLTIVGLDISTRPPVRHVEKLTLRLTENGQMEVSKQVDFYPGGYPHPFAEASYRGTLRQITDAEERALGREVLESGELPRATIEEHRSVTSP